MVTIQRIQTNRGSEFFARKVQKRFMEYGIKFRPIKPGSPHLNGKVEHSQKTNLEEFYASINLKSDKLEEELQEWQYYYNWNRIHGSLKGKTPLWDEVDNMYKPSKEYSQESNYRIDQQLKKLKLCL